MLGKNPERYPNQLQIKRLYTLTSERGWTREGVHRLIEVKYKVFSTKDLTLEQYDEVVKYLETVIVSNNVTMHRDKLTLDIFGDNK